MGLSHSPSIVMNGLVLCLDAGNRKSYPGSGTTWTDLSGRGNNGTLANLSDSFPTIPYKLVFHETEEKLFLFDSTSVGIATISSNNLVCRENEVVNHNISNNGIYGCLYNSTSNKIVVISQNNDEYFVNICEFENNQIIIGDSISVPLDFNNENISFTSIDSTDKVIISVLKNNNEDINSMVGIVSATNNTISFGTTSVLGVGNYCNFIKQSSLWHPTESRVVIGIKTDNYINFISCSIDNTDVTYGDVVPVTPFGADDPNHTAMCYHNLSDKIFLAYQSSYETGDRQGYFRLVTLDNDVFTPETIVNHSELNPENIKVFSNPSTGTVTQIGLFYGDGANSSSEFHDKDFVQSFFIDSFGDYISTLGPYDLGPRNDSQYELTFDENSSKFIFGLNNARKLYLIDPDNPSFDDPNDSSFIFETDVIIVEPIFVSNNGGYFSFDGIDDYVETNVTFSDLGIYDAPYSMCAWFRVSDTSGDNMIFGTRVNANTREGLHHGVRDDTFYFGHFSADASGGTAVANTWYYGTWIWTTDSPYCRIYIDGSLVGSSDEGSYIGSQTIALGAGWGDDRLYGNIAQVSIYNRALTASEIQQNYNALKSRFGL